MLISTRGRYALRVLTDMAEHDGGGYLPLKEVAARQGISEKYLESVLKVLVRSGILTGMRGKGGNPGPGGLPGARSGSLPAQRPVPDPCHVAGA